MLLSGFGSRREDDRRGGLSEFPNWREDQMERRSDAKVGLVIYISNALQLEAVNN